jgi:hypothetical protein
MATSARASLANVSERAILPPSIVASIQNPCRASLGYCSAMAMQERVAREDRPLQVVLCESALGVCRDARISRIAGAADLVRRRAQCRLQWVSTLERPGSVCGRNVKPGELGSANFS